MRLSLTKNIHKIIIYLGLLTLLFSLLLLSGRVGENTAGKSSSIKIQSEQTKNTGQPISEVSNSEDGENVVADTQNTNSTSTRIHISVSSNNSTNDTTGSFSLSINGNDNNLSTTLGVCLEKGEVEIDEDGSEIECKLDEDGLKIDWSSKYNEDQTNDSSFSFHVERD